MSYNGITNPQFPLTIDGLSILNTDEIYIDGQPVQLGNYVPYTGASKTINLNSQNIQTSHTPSQPNDLVNLTTLTNAITYTDNANALTYLNKITGSAQTVAGPITYNAAQTSNEKDYFYKGQLFIGGYSQASSWETDVIDGPSTTENPLQFKHFQTDKKVIFRADGKIYSEALTASKALVSDASGNIVSSGVDASKIDYLDNVSSDIQTQLNNRLKLDGSNANTNIDISSYKVQSSATPSTGNDYTNKTYVDSAITSAGAGYLPLTGGTISGPLTCQDTLTVNTRILGTPDGATNGNFWIGLKGSDTEVNRLAIDIIGNQTTGTVSKVSISKPLYLEDSSSIVADRVLGISSQKKVFSTIATTTEIGYLSGVNNSIQTQLDTKASKTYVDTEDAKRVLIAGDTMTGHLYNTGGSFHPYKAGDKNKGCILFANNADGADYTNYNGGLASWFGIGFQCTNDSTTRFIFNTRDGNSKQTGQIDCGSLTTAGTITSTDTGTSAGVLAKRYYLTARGDNQDEKSGDEKFGPWYGLGDSGITGFTGKPCLAGYYGCALRSGSGYLVLTDTGNIGMGTTTPLVRLEISDSNAMPLNITRTGAGNNYGSGITHSLVSSSGSFKGNYARVFGGSDGAIATSAQTQCQGYYCIDIAKNGVFKSDSDATLSAFYMTNTQGVFNVPVGVVGQVSIGLSSNTTPNLKFANAFSHIDDNPGEVYLFTAYSGHLSIGYDTTRSASTANLVLGVSGTDEAQIISVNTINDAYKPLNFVASTYYFDTGYVGIGKPSSGTYQAPVAKFTINSSYVGGDVDGLAINAYDGSAYSMRLFPYFQAGGQVGYQFRTYNGASYYDSIAIGYNGNIGLGNTIPRCSIYNNKPDPTGWSGWSYFGSANRGVVVGTYLDNCYIGGHNSTLNAWENVFINPGGRVCVGNSTMTYKLNVDGDAFATGSLLFGSYGTYTPGCIYSNSDWGCIIRGKTASPAMGHFKWSSDNDLTLMRITPAGVLNFNGSATPSAIDTGLTNIAGQVVIGGVNKNYNANWGSGLLMECSETTSITVHDSGEKLASFMYYDTDNRFYMGKDAGSGWGTTPIQIESTLYYSNPPAQSRGGTAGYGAVLGWDVIDKRVVATTVEGYHLGPYTDNLQVNWNGLNRTSQFYKSFNNQGLLIHGVATNYRDSAGFQNITVRLYNQSTYQYFYYGTYIYTNTAYNHSPIPFAFECGSIPAGWYDVYTYINPGYGICDGNDAISMTFLVLPMSITSP